VLGPLLNSVLPHTVTTRRKIQIASIFPLFGFIVSFLTFNEVVISKSDISKSNNNYCIKIDNGNNFDMRIDSGTMTRSSDDLKIVNSEIATKQYAIPLEIRWLVLDSFLLMFALSTETIYAMFLKDVFGEGEKTLSTIFAVNGLAVGIIQVFLIKTIINKIGKLPTLAMGHIFLSLAMIGVAMIRNKYLHYLMFSIHILGYSIADTSLVSLFSSYSLKSTGRNLAYCQAAQSSARILSPLIAGYLYQRSMMMESLPIGSLPYLFGAVAPALGIIIPVILRGFEVRSEQNCSNPIF
jgi:Na+/melibiose symporter-like transporter